MDWHRFLIFSGCLIGLTGGVNAITHNPHLPKEFVEIAVPREDGSTLRFYLTSEKSPEIHQKPLIVYLDGSGCNSQFSLEDGVLFDTYYGMLARMAAPWARVAAPEKRGVLFGYQGDGSGENCPAEYTLHATRNQRVADTALLINTLERRGWINDSILVVGHSEGASIAAGMTEWAPQVSHVAFLSGGGPSQMFDLMILQRKNMRAEGKPPELIEAELKKMETAFQDILAAPDSAEKFFMGHAYRRWSGYFLHPPLESLLRSKAKLYLVHGSEDQSVPVESFDLLVAELIRNQRSGTVVRRLPGRGHGLGYPNQPPGVPPLKPILEDVLNWFYPKPDQQGDALGATFREALQRFEPDLRSLETN